MLSQVNTKIHIYITNIFSSFLFNSFLLFRPLQNIIIYMNINVFILKRLNFFLLCIISTKLICIQPFKI